MSGNPERHVAARFRKMGERRFLIRGNDVFELDPVAALIWQLCDGEKGLDAIVDAVAAAYLDAARATVVKDVEKFLGQLAAAGLIVEVAP